MSPTAEAWFAAIGVFVTVCVPIIIGIALVNRVGHNRRPAQPVSEYPQPRVHDRGECWCGEVHEVDTVVEQSWSAS
jgi:hypothetical protein